jgi:type IV pilus assembly protein PilF
MSRTPGNRTPARPTAAPAAAPRAWSGWAGPTSRQRGTAAALAVGVVLALAACTSVDQPPQVVRDLRGTADVRENRRDPPPADTAEQRAATSIAGGGPQVDSEQRRRAQIRLELASGFYQQRNYTQALEELRSALSNDPSYAAAFGLLGLVYMDLGERVRAEESFQRALQIAPDDSEILNNYGWFLCNTDRPREGIVQFQAALKNPLYATPARPLHNAGICSLKAGDTAGAEAYFQRAFQLDPRNPVSMYHLGELFLKRGDLERARFHSQRLLSSYPASAETLWLAIRIEKQAGDQDGLASLSAQMRRQFPNSREASLLQRGAFGD